LAEISKAIAKIGKGSDSDMNLIFNLLLFAVNEFNVVQSRDNGVIYGVE